MAFTNTVVYTLPADANGLGTNQINSSGTFVGGTFSVEFTYDDAGVYQSSKVLSANVNTGGNNTNTTQYNTYTDTSAVEALASNYAGDHTGASIAFDPTTGALSVKFQALKTDTNNINKQTGLDKDYSQISFSFTDEAAKSSTDNINYSTPRPVVINALETEYYSENTNAGGNNFKVNNPGQSDKVGRDDTLTAACYTKGTFITTANGEVAIEDLAVGDQLMTTSGKLEPVIWLGNSTIHCERQLNKDKTYPVRIAKDTFGTNLPKRDLFVSPDHSLYLDGVMIPAYCLINGSTITQDRTETLVTYYHVELPKHNAILAEGLPAESYLETSEANRNFFKAGTAANATNVTKLDVQYPACPEGTPAWQHIWDTQGYAKLTQSGPILEAVKAKLAERVEVIQKSTELVTKTAQALAENYEQSSSGQKIAA